MWKGYWKMKKGKICGAILGMMLGIAVTGSFQIIQKRGKQAAQTEEHAQERGKHHG